MNLEGIKRIVSLSVENHAIMKPSTKFIRTNSRLLSLERPIVSTLLTKTDVSTLALAAPPASNT